MFKAPASPARAIHILIPVTIDMLAVGMVVPVLPGLVVHLAGGDLVRGAWLVGLLGTGFALVQLLAIPILGQLADRFGRRPIVLAATLGLAVDYVVMALAPSVAWLVLGRVMAGATAAVGITAAAYVADITPPERRAAAFGFLGAAFGVGFVVGPALGGFLGEIGLRLPFWVAGALSLANAGYAALLLPESLPAARRSPLRVGAMHPWAALQVLRGQVMLRRWAVVHVLSVLAHTALTSTFVLQVGYAYGWGQQPTGLSLAAVGVASFVVQGLLIGPITKRLSERRALLLGLGSSAIGLALLGLIIDPTGFWLALGPLALWGLATAVIQAAMTRRVAADHQGRLQGALGALTTVAGLAGSALFPALLAFGVAAGSPLPLPGLAMLVAALIMVPTTLLGWRLAAPGRLPAPSLAARAA